MSRVSEVNLEAFSIRELEQLGERIGQVIAEKREARKRELLEDWEKRADAEGLSVAEVMKAGRRRRRSAAPKYRNPGNPGETWSGRGKKPAWVQQALAAGKSLESLAIKS